MTGGGTNNITRAKDGPGKWRARRLFCGRCLANGRRPGEPTEALLAAGDGYYTSTGYRSQISATRWDSDGGGRANSQPPTDGRRDGRSDEELFALSQSVKENQEFPRRRASVVIYAVRAHSLYQLLPRIIQGNDLCEPNAGQNETGMKRRGGLPFTSFSPSLPLPIRQCSTPARGSYSADRMTKDSKAEDDISRSYYIMRSIRRLNCPRNFYFVERNVIRAG